MLKMLNQIRTRELGATRGTLQDQTPKGNEMMSSEYERVGEIFALDLDLDLTHQTNSISLSLPASVAFDHLYRIVDVDLQDTSPPQSELRSHDRGERNYQNRMET